MHGDLERKALAGGIFRCAQHDNAGTFVGWLRSATSDVRVGSIAVWCRECGHRLVTFELTGKDAAGLDELARVAEAELAQVDAAADQKGGAS